MSVNPHLHQSDDGLPSYLARLTQMPLLGPEEEAELTRQARAGCETAKKRLIESNMRLVINIARNYRSRAFSLEDLIQEGAIGLMQAVERFDPDKGFRFSTYATHWIRQSIGRAIDNKAKAIRLPAHVSQSLRRIERERQRLSRELGREPSPEQIALAMGISPNKLLRIVQSSQDLLSLDMTVSDGSMMTLGALIRDDAQPNPEASAVSGEITEELKHIVRELNDREQRVIRVRFEMDGQDSQTEDVAQELKLTRERIRQIEVQAIKKLRLLAQRRRLRELLNP
ncbi:MAG: RNA polymerase sigma factor RpoD/SigA [Armatimonadetes bacterium]|nr:RNA polymerase sigma factor RpoD/SigA [Armatimonadota bacterium]